MYEKKHKCMLKAHKCMPKAHKCMYTLTVGISMKIPGTGIDKWHIQVYAKSKQMYAISTQTHVRTDSGWIKEDPGRPANFGPIPNILIITHVSMLLIATHMSMLCQIPWWVLCYAKYPDSHTWECYAKYPDSHTREYYVMPNILIVTHENVMPNTLIVTHVSIMLCQISW